MYRDIGVPGMLDIPLVGEGIATDDNFKAGVLEDETNRPITGMNSRHRPNSSTVFLVDHRVYGLVVKLFDRDLTRLRTQNEVPGFSIPVKGLQEMLDSISRAHVFSRALGTPY